MREVGWIVKGKTLVDTDDETIATDQVTALLDGREYDDSRDGVKLCVATFELVAIVDVAEPRLEVGGQPSSVGHLGHSQRHNQGRLSRSQAAIP